MSALYLPILTQQLNAAIGQGHFVLLFWYKGKEQTDDFTPLLKLSHKWLGCRSLRFSFQAAK